MQSSVAAVPIPAFPREGSLAKSHHHPSGGNSLRERVRPATAAELDSVPWLRALGPAERERAQSVIVVGDAEPGDLVCRVGRPPTYWFGVIEGLLKMSKDRADGSSMTYSGLPS